MAASCFKPWSQRHGEPTPGVRVVEISCPEAAQKAIEMFNRKPFMERSLTVSEAKSQSSRLPPGDRGGRRA